MKAERSESGDVIVALSPEEAHVFIWGGPESIVSGLDGALRAALIAVEDRDMSDQEYHRRFDDLDAMYTHLRPKLALYGFLGQKGV